MAATNNGRRYSNKRKKAVKKMLEGREDPYDVCHWCKAKIVWFQLIGVKNILTKYNHEGPPPPVIEYIYGGERCAHPWASVDHVVPLSEGGANRLDNLVPACFECNNQRTN